MQEDHFKDIWELYGVSENPFSTSPLLVIGGSIPIESFVGRSQEINRLSKILGSKGGSRNFIYGDIGIGKTTFVNVVRSAAYESGFFTHFKEITTQDNWSSDDFILNTLSAIYSTLILVKDKKHIISKESIDALESLFRIGKSGKSVSASVARFGAGFSGGSERIGNTPYSSLQELFSTVITDINKKTGKEVIIHYNNLELVSEKKLKYLFNHLRDFFQTQGTHFVFIGNLTAYSILQSVPRFSSILSDTPFHIETLSLEEVKEIIQKRFNHLKISDDINTIIPYTQDCLRSIYELMGGNIRDILNTLSTAILEATNEHAINLDRNTLADTLKDILETRYLNNVTPKAREVLMEIVKHSEVTNKALSDKLKIERSNVSMYIKNLEQAGCVYLRRKNGKDKFWKADPKIKWALLERIEQTGLEEFMVDDS